MAVLDPRHGGQPHRQRARAQCEGAARGEGRGARLGRQERRRHDRRQSRQAALPGGTGQLPDASRPDKRRRHAGVLRRFGGRGRQVALALPRNRQALRRHGRGPVVRRLARLETPQQRDAGAAARPQLQFPGATRRRWRGERRRCRDHSARATAPAEPHPEPGRARLRRPVPGAADVPAQRRA